MARWELGLERRLAGVVARDGVRWSLGGVVRVWGWVRRVGWVCVCVVDRMDLGRIVLYVFLLLRDT